ncbi:Ig-like domain-containing protein [Paenibacillus sacheonensis]|uniref:BIG2 domain-containing protein n=1 Tax=Paenibacillus sacheonensis TaxID=742054 RepID=A0A7X4YUR7_9BACL|nr:Ig-like domain-containing protein [Paenibacillus sacheonensis]MBM7568061.1 uncharacterized protein YjdB [Paenibacillus sacheonensis]NBC72910.1 hypothetical protein [Paenibacillus sacheonensis]
MRNKWKTSMALSVIMSIIVMLAAPAYAAQDAKQHAAAFRANFYVSTSGSDEWSGTLAEPNTTTTDGPFRTLGRAQEAVRSSIAAGMSADVVVAVREGTYEINETLSMTEEDSGRDGHQVVYRNYPGELPVLSAGKRLTDWTTEDGIVYEAKLDPSLSFDTMYENGARSIKARYPNQGAPREGYNHVSAYLKDTPKRAFAFASGDIPLMKDVSELEAVVWGGGPDGEWSWSRDTIGVDAVDFEKGTVTLKSDSTYELGKGSRYFVQGNLQLLDAPGEFYVDQAGGTLYYRPYKLPIANQTIVVPTLGRILSFVGSSAETPVQNLVWDGISVEHGDANTVQLGSDQEDGAVYLSNAKDIAIKNSRIENVGLTGIQASGYAQGIAVSGNEIGSIGNTGVRFNAPYATRSYVNKNNTIVNNHIYSTGQIFGSAAGLELANSGDSTIAHNRIHDTPRNAISLSATPINQSIGQQIEGTTVTEGNKLMFVQTKNNVFEYNDLSNANTDSQDTGLFYSWGLAMNNTFSHNYVHDSNIYFSFGYAVYLDDEAYQFTVADNLITHQQDAGEGQMRGSFFVKGIGNKLVNNVLANSPNAQSGFTTAQSCCSHGPTSGNDYVGNIFYNAGQSLYAHNGWAADVVANNDYNAFYQPNGKYILNNTTGAVTLADWQSVQNGAYDQHSVITDRLFANAAGEDFRLAYDSLARGLGIHSLDVSQMGLLPGYPFADAADKLDRVYVQANMELSGDALSLKDKQQAQLSVLGRTKNGYAIAVDHQHVSFKSDNAKVAGVNDLGVVRAGKAGKAKITVTVNRDGFVSKQELYVFVGDRLSDDVMQTPKQTLVLDETTSLHLYGQTALGQVMNLPGASISYRSSDESVVKVDAAGNLKAAALGSATVTATVKDKETGAVFRKQAVISVVTAKLNGLKATLEHKGLHPGESSPIRVTGTMSDDTDADLTKAAFAYVSDNEKVATVDAQGKVAITGTGSAYVTVTATLQNVTKTARIYLVTFAQEQLPASWKVASFGNASGTASFLDGRYTVSSNGYDVWGKADDFVYLYQNAHVEDGEELSVTAHIESVNNTNGNASSGVMLRSGTGDGDKHVHFRLLPSGDALIVYRTETGGESSYAYGLKFQYPEGGTIRLTKTDKVVTVSYLDTAKNEWVKLQDIAIDLGNDVLAGVGVFAQSDVLTESKISDLEVKVGK